MDKYLEAMSTDDRFTDEEKKSIALEMFLKRTEHFDPQEPTPDPEALRNELLMAKSAFRGEGQLLGDDEKEEDTSGTLKKNNNNNNNINKNKNNNNNNNNKKLNHMASCRSS